MCGKVIQQGVCLGNIGEWDELLWSLEQLLPALNQSIPYRFVFHFHLCAGESRFLEGADAKVD
jgi:hypothetical protein